MQAMTQRPVKGRPFEVHLFQVTCSSPVSHCNANEGRRLTVYRATRIQVLHIQHALWVHCASSPHQGNTWVYTHGKLFTFTLT